MELVNPDERKQLRKRIIEKTRPNVADLFVDETEKSLKKRYELSLDDDLAKSQLLLEPT